MSKLQEALETPIIGCRDLTAEDKRNINTLYQAARDMQTLVEARERATPTKWHVHNIGKHRNNPKLDDLAICFGDITEHICDTVYNMTDAKFITLAANLTAKYTEKTQWTIKTRQKHTER
ncbi:MAG: hypothetical protein ACUZ8H_10380 [Candidatus Anammoxibacter sp.]